MYYIVIVCKIYRVITSSMILVGVTRPPPQNFDFKWMSVKGRRQSEMADGMTVIGFDYIKYCRCYRNSYFV